MSERSISPAPTETQSGITKFDIQTGEWRPLNTQEFLQAEDQPGSVWELGFQPGDRPWFLDLWDNVILSIRKQSIMKDRIEAKAFWDSHFTLERMVNRFQLPITPERGGCLANVRRDATGRE